MLPAFLYSCMGTADIQPHSSSGWASETEESAGRGEIRSLDIFVFRDDELQKLDCYQRFDDMDDWKGTIVSGEGKRIVSAIANGIHGREYWFPINSRSYLKKVIFNLEAERRESPFMTGESQINASNHMQSPVRDLAMSPFVSEIRLKSISCDFTGKAYEGEKIRDMRVYLTNVNADCGLLDDDGSFPRRIINFRGLQEEDVENFVQPDLIVQKVIGEVGVRTFYPNIRLWCYQSNHPEESPGTPFTRLVIEGRISGQTYYWPININRETDEEAGVWRNRQYTYDVKITRKGSTDPDIPVKTEDIIINQEVAKWKEKEEYTVSF